MFDITGSSIIALFIFKCEALLQPWSCYGAIKAVIVIILIIIFL